MPPPPHSVNSQVGRKLLCATPPLRPQLCAAPGDKVLHEGSRGTCWRCRWCFVFSGARSALGNMINRRWVSEVRVSQSSKLCCSGSEGNWPLVSQRNRGSSQAGGGLPVDGQKWAPQPGLSEEAWQEAWEFSARGRAGRAGNVPGRTRGARSRPAPGRGPVFRAVGAIQEQMSCGHCMFHGFKRESQGQG